MDILYIVFLFATTKVIAGCTIMKNVPPLNTFDTVYIYFLKTRLPSSVHHVLSVPACVYPCRGTVCTVLYIQYILYLWYACIHVLYPYCMTYRYDINTLTSLKPCQLSTWLQSVETACSRLRDYMIGYGGHFGLRRDKNGLPEKTNSNSKPPKKWE